MACIYYCKCLVITSYFSEAIPSSYKTTLGDFGASGLALHYLIRFEIPRSVFSLVQTAIRLDFAFSATSFIFSPWLHRQVRSWRSLTVSLILSHLFLSICIRLKYTLFRSERSERRLRRGPSESGPNRGRRGGGRFG